jgi:signal transduction histidine kinase
MTDVERQILKNLIAILEALAHHAPAGKESTRELLHQRLSETARLVREANGRDHA